jgi:hypothetical protein
MITKKKDKIKISSFKPKPPRLSFSSQEDSLNYARHVVEDSKRRLAAYDLIERYIDGDYYIAISEWCRIGRNDQVYDLIFSSVPYKLGDRCSYRSIDAICLDAIDDKSGDNANFGKFAVLVSDTYVVECPEKIIPVFVWLELTKKRYDFRRNILTAPLNHGLQLRRILGEGKISALGIGGSRGDSNGIPRLVEGSPKMFNSLSCNDGEIIREGFSKLDLVQIIKSLRITLYNVGPLLCIEERYYPLFEGKKVLICAREPEF